MTKAEKQYREFCHDLAEITRAYWRENPPPYNDSKYYPTFRPGFRAYIARELKKKGYFKITCKVSNLGLIK